MRVAITLINLLKVVMHSLALVHHLLIHLRVELGCTGASHSWIHLRYVIELHLWGKLNVHLKLLVRRSALHALHTLHMKRRRLSELK